MALKKLFLLSALMLVCLSCPALAQENGAAAASTPEEASAIEKLAESLAAAKTDGERSDLVNRGAALVKPALVQELFKRGKALEGQKNYAPALALYEFAQTMAERLDDRRGIVEAYVNIGGLYSAQGKREQAIEIFQKGLELGERWGEQKSSAVILAFLGMINRSQGNYEEALKLFEKSLALSEAVQYQRNIHYSLLNIGILYRLQGDYAKALEYAQKTLAISESLKDKKMIAGALHSLGNIQSMQGNHQTALDSFQRAAALNKEVGDKGSLAGLLTNIGIVYEGQGNYEQAQQYHAQSLALYQELGNRSGEAFALNNLGTLHSNMKRYTEALEYYQRSLKLRTDLNEKQNIAETVRNIGTTQAALGDYASALDSVRQSLALWQERGNKVGEALALNEMGFIYYRQGNQAQAIEAAERAANIFREVGNREFLWNTRLTAARAYFALKQFDQTRQALTEAIAIIEELRAQVVGNEAQQARSFEQRLAPYQLMAELLLAENKRGEALNYAELAKARVLLDVVRSGRVNITKAMTADEQERERQLNTALLLLNNQLKAETSRPKPDQAKLADLKARLQKARLEREDFQTRLYAAHPELKVKRGEAEPLKLEEMGNLLADNKGALLEFMLTDNRLFLFVITGGRETPAQPAKTNLSVYPIEIKPQKLAALIESFRQKLGQRALDFRQPARELFDLLLKPAAPELKGKTSLIILPDGVLWDLPFQALQSAEGHYLVEDHAISYSHSLMVLREMMKSRQRLVTGKATGAASTATLLAFGNPALNQRSAVKGQGALLDAGLGPLPETEKQVTRLAQLYGQSRSRIYTGAEAREGRAKAEAGNYRLLQFATHAVLDDTNPMYSHVLLSQTGEQNEDGRLEAWEMMNLNLRAEMVVLSACETARGRVNPGEGVVGMTWALFIAGSPVTVVSQWKVDSASTTQLMLEFHSQIRASEQRQRTQHTKAEALRQAALKLMKTEEYRHPFYWAGFVVVGDAR
jgi:CHAT domain-containing protein/lipopolysaccharide biosynthesis regulator YciM